MPGDAVVELGVAGPGGAEEPRPTVARQPSRGREAEPALAAARAAKGEDQRAGHRHASSAPRHGAITARPTSVARADLDARAQAVPIEPAARPAMSAVATRPSRAADQARRPAAEQPIRPSAVPSGDHERDRDGPHDRVAARNGVAEPGAQAVVPDPVPEEHDREHGQPARHGAADDDDRRGHHGTPRRGHAGERGDLGAQDEQERDGAARPDGRILAGAFRGVGVGRDQGVGRIGQAVQVQAAGHGGEDRHRGDRAQHRLAGQGQEHERHRREASDGRPDEGEGRGPRDVARRSGRAAGSAARRRPARWRRPRPIPPNEARRAPCSARPDRQAHERRVHAEHRPDPVGPEGRGRRAVGHDPALAHDHDAGEEMGGQREVVEDRDDGRPVALVEVHEQLHDVDLVADVEVRGRLVEDQDRRRLGDRHGDEHELALAHRQLADVAMTEVGDADPLHRRRRPRGRSAGRRPVKGGSWGSRPRATTSWTGISNGSWMSSGTTAIVRATADRWTVSIGAPHRRTAPELGRSTPVIARSRLDLPAPLGPTSATRSPPAISSVADVTTRRSP